VTTYPESFQSGVLRQKLQPPQTPQLGLYSSENLEVVETHIDWAAEHGIDFFLLKHSAGALKDNLRLQLFTHASNISDIEFCLSYSLSDLPLENDGSLAQAGSDQLMVDLQELAETYLKHPQYLRVAGRPVVVLEGSGALRGAYKDILASLRSGLEQSGHNVFVIGAEMDWSFRADLSDVQLYDGVMALHLFDPSRPERAGYGAFSSFLADVAALHRRYQAAAGDKVVVVPTVLPGFNDRGRWALEGSGAKTLATRGVLPRAWDSGAGPVSFLAEMLDRYAVPLADPGLPMVVIDSWNDWAKDTAIEPLAVAGPTSQDVSGRHLYTAEYEYEGFALANLAVVRDRLVAVSGTLVSQEHGAPLAGVPVGAWRNGDLLAVDISDSRGRFHLSRLTMESGDYVIGATYGEGVDVFVGSQTSTQVKLRSELEPASRKARSGPTLGPLFPSLRRHHAAFMTAPGGSPSPASEESGTVPLPSAEQIPKLVAAGQTVVQVGDGRGALLAAQVVGQKGQVYAFDADAEGCRQLLRQAQSQGLTNVEPLWYALAGTTGIALVDGTSVEQRTLDSFHLQRADLLWIGRQASAEAVLSGATELVGGSQPKILVELSAQSPLPQVLGRLASLGYRSQRLPVPSELLLGVPFGQGGDRVFLDLGSRPVRDAMEEGFSADESDRSGLTYVWSDDVESLLYLSLPQVPTGDYLLGIRAQAFGPLAPVDVAVLVNGALVGRVEVGAAWMGAELQIPEGLLVPGRNSVLFQYGVVGRPSGLLPGQLDTRALSVAFDLVWLCPVRL
jgi:precorrin-6B methylase 2